MKKVKNILTFLMAAVLLCAMSMTVFASDELPNPERKGKITVTVMYTDKDTNVKKPVSGGSLKLYQIAAVRIDDGNYSFVYEDAFSGCEWDLGEKNIQSEELVKNLGNYIAAQEAGGKKIPVRESARVGANGVAEFHDNLELGLYLVVQDVPADGYSKLSPFLVSIPVKEDGKLLYEVDASPKAQPVQKTLQPDKSTPSKPTPSKLPQTGMLWWPVPILAVSGMVLFLIGWLRRQRSGE